ncbi:hypothetical protein EC991_009491 [Linnemannia zychae]|nr:hypothetical protein EC991_009491 [Linnemannia zychae]
MNTTGSLDTGGGYSSQSSGFGYDGLALGGVGPAVALGSGLHGYDNEYQSQHQSLRPQPQQSYYPSSQALSYTPPTEPDIAPEDRYDPTYAARREQEAAYMNYQQQQLYLQSQRQLQQQQKQQQYLAGQLSMPMPTIPPAPAGSLESQLNTYGTQDGYRPDNRFSAVSADSQTYLERLRGSYPPTGIEQGLISAEGGALGAAVMNARTPSPAMTPPMPVPPIGAGYPAGQQHILPSGQQQQQVLQSSPSFVDPAAYVAAGTAGSMTGSEDYAYPESDARRVPSNDRWASPPKPADSTLHPQAITVQPANPHSINNNEAATVGAASSTTQGELTPPMTNRFAEGEVTAAAAAGEVGSHGGVGSPGRSSVLSQASSTMSGLNPKRLNSPQLIPSPKRAPQVLHPEVEPTITMIPPRE